MSDFEITFLGTCAHDFSPKLDNKFKERFDLDARRASCVLLNGKILIDCGPHCCNSLDIISKNYGEITDVIFTHFHSDHYNVENLMKIAGGRKKPLRIWVRADAMLPKMPNIRVIKMKNGMRYALGDIFVTGLEANHGEGVNPQWILLERGKKKLLYALDGAWYLTDTYNFLKKSRLDAIVMDATVGDYTGDYRMAEHNSIPMIRLMLPSLKTAEIIDDKTKIYLSHIAPSLHKPHKETAEIARSMGAILAYDGMKINI